MYGEAAPEIQAVCKERALPLHVFPWRPEMAAPACGATAVYLVRPDGYVAVADSGESRRDDYRIPRHVEGDAEDRRRTNALTAIRAVRVAPSRFGRPEAGEQARILLTAVGGMGAPTFLA